MNGGYNKIMNVAVYLNVYVEYIDVWNCTVLDLGIARHTNHLLQSYPSFSNSKFSLQSIVLLMI